MQAPDKILKFYNKNPKLNWEKTYSQNRVYSNIMWEREREREREYQVQSSTKKKSNLSKKKQI